MHMAKRLTDVCKRTVFFHVPNGEKRDAVTAGLLRQMGVRPGVADFILCDCLPFAQADNVTKVTLHLNGGYTGLADRIAWLHRWKLALGV